MSKINEKPVVFTRFNPPPSPSVLFKDASLTRQEFAEESDLNNLMRKYASGLPPSPRGARPPVFGDFSNVPNYQDALDKVIEAQSLFGDLPSQVRKRFDNDPAKLIEFISDKSNIDEAIKLGLVRQPDKPVEDRQTEVSVPGDKTGAA